MLEIKGREFFTAVTNLTYIHSYLVNTQNDEGSVFHKERKLQETDRAFILPRLKVFVDNLSSLSAPITTMAAGEAIVQIGNDWCTWQHVLDALVDIDRTLKRELTKVTLLSLDGDEKEMFEQGEPPFGEAVHTAFPSSRYDISEAAKCLALDRGTACVFHLTRALEAPLHCLLKEVGIKEPPPNWNKGLNDFDSSLSAVQTQMEKNSKEKPAGWKEKEQFLSEASAHLRNIKNAWRNDASHIGEKYTVDEASRIYWATQNLFEVLAKRLSEDACQEQPA
jgi:hypothetical protein